MSGDFGVAAGELDGGAGYCLAGPRVVDVELDLAVLVPHGGDQGAVAALFGADDERDGDAFGEGGLGDAEDIRGAEAGADFSPGEGEAGVPRVLVEEVEDPASGALLAAARRRLAALLV